jgi:hypothetical protein
MHILCVHCYTDMIIIFYIGDIIPKHCDSRITNDRNDIFRYESVLTEDDFNILLSMQKSI